MSPIAREDEARGHLRPQRRQHVHRQRARYASLPSRYLTRRCQTTRPAASCSSLEAETAARSPADAACTRPTPLRRSAAGLRRGGGFGHESHRFSAPQCCDQRARSRLPMSANSLMQPRRPRPRGRGSVDGDVGDDAAGMRRHHQHAVGQVDRFRDVVGDEHDGRRGCAPRSPAIHHAGARGSSHRARRTARPSESPTARSSMPARSRPAAAFRRTIRADSDRRIRAAGPSPAARRRAGDLCAPPLSLELGGQRDVACHGQPGQQHGPLKGDADLRRRLGHPVPSSRTSPAVSGVSPPIIRMQRRLCRSRSARRSTRTAPRQHGNWWCRRPASAPLLRDSNTFFTALTRMLRPCCAVVLRRPTRSGIIFTAS